MEEAPLVREAVEALLRDVEPAPFRDRLERTIEGRPLVPGVLTVRTATAVDAAVAREAAADRGAGVQLTYEGLRLTRRLVEEEPWPPAGDDDPDADVLAAEVLVAKGLGQLAYTGVRERVVEIVRRFGRVHFRSGSRASEATAVPDVEHAGPARSRPDPTLDSDIVVLAVAAGADLAAQTVPPGLVEYARELAADLEVRPLAAGEALADVEEDVRRIVAATEPSAEERSRSSMDP